MALTDVAEQEQIFLVEFEQPHFPGMPPHILNLKERMPLILLRNVNPTQGLCNRTRLLVTRLGEGIVGEWIAGKWIVEVEAPSVSQKALFCYDMSDSKHRLQGGFQQCQNYYTDNNAIQ